MTADRFISWFWPVGFIVTVVILLMIAVVPAITPAAQDATAPIVAAASRYDAACETLADRTRTLASCKSALHLALVEPLRGPRIRALANTLLYASGEVGQAQREVAEAERVLAQALLAGREEK